MSSHRSQTVYGEGNARIQSFPDEWKFCGSVGSQYKQVGNAVPVNLAYAVAQEIYKSLEML